MISEGSCDTEDWSNDAENSALIIEINYILLYIRIEDSYFKLQHYTSHSLLYYSSKSVVYSFPQLELYSLKL